MTHSSDSQRLHLLKQRARAMRFALTPSEQILWDALRAKKLGVQFRRQQVVAGRYIADFLAPSIRLIVEIDGDAYHATRSAADAQRDRRLREAGYRVVRIRASQVRGNPSRALTMIFRLVGTRG